LYITSNTTWSTNQILTQEVIVNPGSRLTIEEGVLVQTVFVDTDLNGIGDVGIMVLGELETLGSELFPVVIEPFESTTDPNYWYGVIINSTTDNPDINYLTINNAFTGMKVQTNASITGIGLNECHYGIVVESTGILNLHHSTIEGLSGSGIFNLDGILNIQNSNVRNNGKFGIVNSSGILTMDTCTVESNVWGGIYIGGLATTTVYRSNIIDNSGAGFEISEYKFAYDFESTGTSEGEPDVIVNFCNINGNSDSFFDLDESVNNNFLSIPNWGTCSSPRPANDGDSDDFEIPFGFISEQTVTGLRYYGSSSSYNRNYKLRNAYNNSVLDNYIHTSTSPANCGSYVPKTFTFYPALSQTDKYDWYIGANSTSSHALYNANTTIRLGEFEVYSTVENDHPFDFTNNYWGTEDNVGDLVLDVYALNIDYSSYSIVELDPVIGNYVQSQHITSDIIWDRDTTLTQMIFIDEGASLTILEDVEIKVGYVDVNGDGIGDCGITVNGELITLGAHCSPVLFRPITQTADQHYWAGININSPLINNWNINYLETQNAHIGIEVNTTASLNGAHLLKSGNAGLKIDLLDDTYLFAANYVVCDSTQYTGIINTGYSVSTIERSLVSNSGHSGIFNTGEIEFENFNSANNNQFGIVNSAGILNMDSCDVEFNSWGGVYIGGMASVDIINSSVTNNTGNGFEISEFTFSDDFQSTGTKSSAPSISVINCNIYDNAASFYNISQTQSNKFFSVPDWGTCNSPSSANNGQSGVFETPIGFIHEQTVTGLRYYGSSSTYNRNYKLRNAYNNSVLDNYIHSSTSPANCGSYVPRTFSFTPTSANTDRYDWYIGANSTSSHALYNASTTLRTGGFEVYSTIGDDYTDFNFNSNYWGVVVGVDALVLDVNNPNINYSGYSTSEYPDAHSNVGISYAPPAVWLGNDTTICEGTVLTLDAGNPGASFLWSTGNTSQSIGVSMGGTYYVTVTSSASCLSNSDTILIVIDSLPTKPGFPSGPVALCENNTNTTYVTSGSSHALSYIWELFPSDAGSISGTTTSAIIDWDNSYSGEAIVTVRGLNDCGEGPLADSLFVNLSSLPEQPETPTGPAQICDNSINTDYSTSGAAGATSYIWHISPLNAGIISGSGTTGTVDWDPAFWGTATITVKGSNACGEGIYSDGYSVSSSFLPTTPGIPSGPATACASHSESYYSTSPSTYANYYTWEVSPAEAGIVIGTTDTVTIEWSPTYSGIATVFVKGSNDCGTGNSSTGLDVTVLQLPGQPGPISGIAELCEDAPDETYTTTGVAGADSYLWTLDPPVAGVVSGNGTSANVDWDQSFNGIVNIYVYGENECGTGVVAATLEITINTVPAMPSTPSGEISLCQDAGNNQYTIPAISNADTYLWELNPVSAGIISGSGITGTVDWDPIFSGTAYITVKGINECGGGSFSDALSVTVEPFPGQAGTPTGESDLCENPVNSIYLTSGATNSTTYLWELSPAESGSITGTGTSATVDWEDGFTGTTSITVTGQNSCGSGQISEVLTVTVNPLPGAAIIPTGSTIVCAGTTEAYISSAINYADTYTWELIPANSGTISGIGTSITIDWDLAYEGNAYLTVAGENSCGAGITSDALVIAIDPVPGTASTPTGPDNVCAGSQNEEYNTTGASNASSYDWILEPAESGTISGTGTAAYVNWDVDFTGLASISVVGTNDCGTGTISGILEVAVDPFPADATVPSGDTELCENPLSSTYTTDVIAFADSYIWTLNPPEAGVINGSTETALVDWEDTFTGIATITVQGTNECGQGMSSGPLSVVINESPETPVITEVDGTLISSSTTGNQWFLNGVLIAGATTQFYTPVETGFYTVEVTNEAGCSTISDYIYFVISGIGDHSAGNTLNIYPNPNHGVFTLSFTSENLREISVQIYSQHGQLMLDELLFDDKGYFIHLFDLHGFARGIYIVRITSSMDVINERIIVK